MESIEDRRPDMYRYFEQLKEHLGGDLSTVFSGGMVYPRQLEIHLPADHKSACNFDCFYCAGLKFRKDLGTFEAAGLKLLYELRGRIPYVIYGGSYTEPLLNPYFMAYLGATKSTGCHFGIHTNGSVLKRLEDNTGWLTELCRIAEDRIDYLSISLDAGFTESHCRTKRVTHGWFSEIIEGIRSAVLARGEQPGPAIRVCYLMNDFNSSEEEIASIVEIMRDIKPDSLRFAIPFAYYAQPFDVVRKYKSRVEVANNPIYYERLMPHLSTNENERPYIFYMSPAFQDVDRFTFDQCIYGYYQVCWAADGYVYRCTTISTPTFSHLRLGKLTSSMDQFDEMVLCNQDPKFHPRECFEGGARCNRMGLEINCAWGDRKD